MRVAARAAGRARLRARRARHQHRRALQRAYFERIPVVALDGEELFEYFVDEAASARASRVTAMSYARTSDGRGRRRDGDRGVDQRAALARRRGAPVALPAGADPGQEDGQGDDLLAGALRLHARQLDPDPPRPVGLRQVRQARRRLQRRGARLADPQDPAHRRPAQHRADRRRATSARRSPRRKSSPTTAFASWRSSTSTARRSARRSATRSVRHIDELRQVVEERGHRRRRARGAHAAPPRASPTSSWRRA